MCFHSPTVATLKSEVVTRNLSCSSDCSPREMLLESKVHVSTLVELHVHVLCCTCIYIMQKMHAEKQVPHPLHELDDDSHTKHDLDDSTCDADHEPTVESTEDNVGHNASIHKGSNEEEEGQLVEEKEEKDISTEEGWVYLKQIRLYSVL